MVMLTAFWVLCVAVGIGFIIGGFGAGSGTGDFVGVRGVVALLAAVVFIGAVINQRRSGNR